ncbi:hypothetical protein ACFV6Y_39335, partial [Streptomyces massasporeus]|uniref:hypothetical protein n=1 Tax=Streptomyces massasporeus TaxID=67324 RepID=UPI00364C180E
MSDHKAEAAYWEAQEQQARAAMSPAELLEYRRHNHEIGDCPHCGKVDVEMQAEVQPDMVGSM